MEGSNFSSGMLSWVPYLATDLISSLILFPFASSNNVFETEHKIVITELRYEDLGEKSRVKGKELMTRQLR